MYGKVSIIIPVYNQVEFFEQCINSIINQSYLNTEIIVVDDGSDGINAKNYDDIAKKDDRIKIYHIINSGVSNARNFGITMSTGQWIMFVDSDDYLEKDAIEFLLTNVGDHKLVMANYCRCENNKSGIDKATITNVYKSSNIKAAALEYEKYVHSFCFIPVENSAFFLSVWAKLYDGELIRNKGIQFNSDLKYCEDLLYNLMYLNEIGDVVLCNRVVYFYRNNPNSASHKNGIEIIHESQKLIEVYLEYDYENTKNFCSHYLLLTFIDIAQLNDSNLYKEYVNLIKRDLVKKAILSYRADYLKGAQGTILRMICNCWQKELYQYSYIIAKMYIALRDLLRR